MLAFCVLFYSTFNTKENFKDNLSRTSQKKYTVANNKLVQSTVQRSIEQNVTMHTYYILQKLISRKIKFFF